MKITVEIEIATESKHLAVKVADAILDHGLEAFDHEAFGLVDEPEVVVVTESEGGR